MSCGVYLDSSLGFLEATRFKRRHSVLISKLSKQTHFSRSEVEALLLIYYKVQKTGHKKQKGMTQNQLRTLLHNALDMTDKNLVSDIVTCLIKGTPSSNRIVPIDQWVKLMSLYARGTLEEKIEYCFKVYDIREQGTLSRDVMLRHLSSGLISQFPSDAEDTEDSIRDLIELILIKMDHDRDGMISLEDFKITCNAQPLLLEFLGECLPSRLAVNTFLTTFTSKVGKL